MDRSDFLRRAGLAGAGVAAGLAPLAGLTSLVRRAGTQAPQEHRPNVLWILTDDQPPRTVRRMPSAIEKIAAAGLDLTDTGYVAIPICSPARVSLLVGTYPHNNGTSDNRRAYEIYRNRRYHDVDVVARLKRAGYRTGFFGKFMNGYGEYGDPGEFVHPFADRWHVITGVQGTPEYGVNKDGKIIGGLKQNHTPYFGERAGEFVRGGASSEQPWFCYLNWTDPHVPFTPFKTHKNSHDGERYRYPGIGDSPEDMSPRGRSINRSRPSYHQERYEGIMEELEGVDDWVGQLLDALEATGQLGNTIVVYSSDNGYMLGEHGGIGHKSHPYEESARVPFLVRGPGIPTRVEGNPLVGHLDLTATILAASGADTSDIDGRDLRELSDPSKPWRKRLLVEHPGRGWAMVRGGRYVYMDLAGESVEIYDMVEDPYQTQNIADTVDTRVKKELRLRLADLRVARGRGEFAAAES